MPPFKLAMIQMDSPVMPDWVRKGIDQAGIDFLHHECRTRQDLELHAADADLVWLLGGDRVLHGGNIRVLSRCGAILRSGSGTDNVPVAEATELGILVANTPEGVADGVANHTIALLLAAMRCIAVQDRLVRQGIWDRKNGWPNHHLNGQTLGLVGFGHIARLVMARLRGFEMKYLVSDPFVDAAKVAEAGARKVELDELFSESDYVSIHCPLLDSTRHLIGERLLRRMKPTAILINTSRGPVIDEPALVRALQEKWIAGAGLDVLEEEPPPKDHPLFALDHVVFTPHIAGYSDVQEEEIWRLSLETVLDLAAGRWPRSCVNPTVQPRWKHLQKR